MDVLDAKTQKVHKQYVLWRTLAALRELGDATLAERRLMHSLGREMAQEFSASFEAFTSSTNRAKLILSPDSITTVVDTVSTLTLSPTRVYEKKSRPVTASMPAAKRSKGKPATASPSQSQKVVSGGNSKLDAETIENLHESISSKPPVSAGKKTILSVLSAEKQARAEALKREIAKKLNTELRMGFDPQLFALGAELTGLYVEAGA